jgi:phospho-N-acetylmuramoyl-pentapeptide-transferase
MTLGTGDAATAFLTAFFVVLALGGKTIGYLAKLKMRQAINTDAPASHMAKQGTPTMGGVLFLFGLIAVTLVGIGTGVVTMDDFTYVERGSFVGPLLAVLLVFLLHLGIGYLDDYLKATRGKSLGLKARQKLALQVIVAAGFAVYLYITRMAPMTAVISFGGGHLMLLPVWLYYPGVAVLMIAMSNFTNLADGLDGLASGLVLIACIGIAITVLPALASLRFFCWGLAGACLGFLIFNGNPARVFMGDTGSLALGSALTAVAVLGKQEIPFLLFMGVFIAEGLSVVLQVVSFKTTGKRIFRMAPLHHHFELLGWTEGQIVLRFWIAGVIFLWLGLLAASRLAPFGGIGIGGLLR